MYDGIIEEGGKMNNGLIYWLAAIVLFAAGSLA